MASLRGLCTFSLAYRMCLVSKTLRMSVQNSSIAVVSNPAIQHPPLFFCFAFLAINDQHPDVLHIFSFWQTLCVRGHIMTHATHGRFKFIFSQADYARSLVCQSRGGPSPSHTTEQSTTSVVMLRSYFLVYLMCVGSQPP